MTEKRRRLKANERARLILRVTRNELDWVKRAARLRHLSLAEYVKRAINASLQREGVDAVLFTEREPAIITRHASAQSVDAVDPYLHSEGKPSTRDKTSFSSAIDAPRNEPEA